MSKNVGITRNAKSLSCALDEINFLISKYNSSTFFNLEKIELKNALIVAKLVAQFAYNRTKSIGAHFRSDCVMENIKITKGNIEDDKILVK